MVGHLSAGEHGRQVRQHVDNFVKYLAVGGACTLLDWGIFALCVTRLGLDYLLVGALGFALGSGLNYLLCIRFVYPSGQRFGARGEIVGIYLISAAGLALHTAILFAAREHLQLHLFASKVLATALALLWNFSMRNFYLFAKPSASGR